MYPATSHLHDLSPTCPSHVAWGRCSGVTVVHVDCLARAPLVLNRAALSPAGLQALIAVEAVVAPPPCPSCFGLGVDHTVKHQSTIFGAHPHISHTLTYRTPTHIAHPHTSHTHARRTPPRVARPSASRAPRASRTRARRAPARVAYPRTSRAHTLGDMINSIIN